MTVPRHNSGRQMDEVEVFRAARPTTAPYSPRARDAARARLLAAARGDEPQPGRARRVTGIFLGRVTARLGWRLTLAGGMAGVLAVAVAVALAGPYSRGGVEAVPSTRPIPAPPVRKVNAVEFLETAAKHVGARNDIPRPGPYQWRYTKTLNRQADATTQTSEKWMRCDGRQMTLDNEEGRMEVVNTEYPPDPDEYSPLQYYDKLRTLPTDPDKLLDRIRGDKKWLPDPVEEQGLTPEHPDDRAFRVITVYLDRGAALMPPKLEAAIYRALAEIPGVRVEQGVVDTVGRTGIGISRRPKEAPNLRRYIVLEPGTYRYLGDGEVPLRATSGSAGTPRPVDLRARGGIEYAEAVREAKIVNKPGQH